MAQPSTDSPAGAPRKSDPPKVLIYKGAVPKDPQYLAYQRWYKSHSLVDLFVDGRDPQHLITALNEIALLRKKKVTIGKVIVVGGDAFPHLSSRTRSKSKNKLAELDAMSEEIRRSRAFEQAGGEVPGWLGSAAELTTAAELAKLDEGSQLSEVESFFKTYKITNSPTWIVTHRGKRYVYEGSTSIVRLFTTEGVFSDSADSAGGSRW